MTARALALASAALLAARPVVASEGLYIRALVAASSRPADVKLLGGGVQGDLGVFSWRGEGGVVVDSRPEGRSSGYGHLSVGAEAEPGPMYAYAFQGFGLITAPDAYLSGRAQFFLDLGLGVGDPKKGVRVGAAYKHVSNAGLIQPNLGKDLIGAEVRLSW